MLAIFDKLVNKTDNIPFKVVLNISTHRVESEQDKMSDNLLLVKNFRKVLKVLKIKKYFMKS